MSDIRAIETPYDGCRFRSRLEARWAVFFNAAGIEYQYEPEGFVLSDGSWYLPDFYLPNVILRDGSKGLWVEVKGQNPVPETDLRKVEAFLGKYVEFGDNGVTGELLYKNPIIVVGFPPKSWVDIAYENDPVFWAMPTLYGPTPVAFYKDESAGNTKLLDVYSMDRWESQPEGFDHFDRFFDAARTARFEHGETPAVRKEARRI